jgi:hypothetical protein
VENFVKIDISGGELQFKIILGPCLSAELCEKAAMLSLGSGCGSLLCSWRCRSISSWSALAAEELSCVHSITTVSFFSAWFDYCWPLEESTVLVYFFP